MRRLCITTAAALVLLLCGCGSQERLPVDRARPPAPRFDLAGRSVARRIAYGGDVPEGPGAEGRPGDWLLENAFVRFVIGSIGRGYDGGRGGNLIDAAMQGGEDRMRLLVPEVGARARLRPVYTAVSVAEEGGVGMAASVVARGHLPGWPGVRVTTTYRLAPDARMLEVRTRVDNDTDEMLAAVSLGDRLYHGRTSRFVPGVGLYPTGRSSSAHWMAFAAEGYVWGVLGPRLMPTRAVHEAGSSVLTYATTDIAPGQGREYRRYVLAEFGGPEKVWLAAEPVPEGELGYLRVALRDEESGKAVPDGLVSVRPRAKGPELPAATGEDGVVELQLPAGRYEVSARAPGRPPSPPRTVECKPGTTTVWSIGLAPAAAARLTLRADIAGIVAPLTGRVTAFPLSRSARRSVRGPAFPVEPPVGTVLIQGGQTLRLPLAPASILLPGSYMLSASKGPLFSAAVARVEALPGAEPVLDAVLDRVVAPGDYVAVDMRQHTDASPDCALTPAERALADACEGLQGAVLVDPPSARVPAPLPSEAECVLLRGLRLERSGVGSFSIFPVDTALSPLPTEPELPPAELLRRLRARFPDALVQVNRPLDPNTGYLALGEFDRTTGTGAREGFAADFDALELLSGGDVQAAKDLLPYWFAMLNSGKRVMATGGSGSTGISGAQAALARTFIHCPTGGLRPTARRLAEAIRALKDAPNAFVTNGPIVIATLNGRPVGSRQELSEGRAELKLSIYGANWVDVRRVRVYRNGEVVADLSVPESTEPLRYEGTHELEVPGDCWFVVVVEGERALLPAYYAGRDTATPFAVTNPFWVTTKGETNGDE